MEPELILGARGRKSGRVGKSIMPVQSIIIIIMIMLIHRMSFSPLPPLTGSRPADTAQCTPDTRANYFRQI